MEQKQKNGLMTALIYVVLFGVYNMLVFLIFSDYNEIFWTSYVFFVLAFLIHIACIASILKEMNVQAVFFGIPLASFSVYFVFAELFTSLVFMIFKDYANIKVTVAVQVILLSIFIIIAVVSIMTRDAVQNVNTKIKENVVHIKALTVDVEMLMQRCTDPVTKNALKKLSETIKYSDPMTTDAVAAQDQMIMQYMLELRTVFDAGDMAGAQNACNRIELLFVERNKLLKIMK